jgi:hypothetical protein
VGRKISVVEINSIDQLICEGIDGDLVTTTPALAKVLSFGEMDLVLPNWYPITEPWRHHRGEWMRRITWG